MPSNITISSLTATSVTVSLTQPPFSFTPVNYTVTLTRVTGSDQVLCTSTQHSRTIAVPSPTNNLTSVMLPDLQEFSAYTITVMARFSEFHVNCTATNSATFTTISTGMFLQYSSYFQHLKILWVGEEAGWGWGWVGGGTGEVTTPKRPNFHAETTTLRILVRVQKVFVTQRRKMFWIMGAKIMQHTVFHS